MEPGRQNTKAQRYGTFHHFMQTLIILAGMWGLFGLLGWLILGPAGLAWSLFMVCVLYVFTPRISPWMVLRMYRARRLSYDDAPGLYDSLALLSRRAGLSAMPLLYYVPSRVMNAFSVGTPQSSAIAVSDGIIRFLGKRELSGVLAHEIIHIRNNDLRLHALADLLTKVTGFLSFVGQVLIALYLPLAMFSRVEIPLIPIVLLIFAPSLSMLLQLALSRTREFEADSGAANLTGDPMGLAMALEKMDCYERSIRDLVYFPGRKRSHPSLLRTHPHTRERYERLACLAGSQET